MSKLRVNAFSVSADGFGAGPDQGQDQPLGRGGEQLHQVVPSDPHLPAERPEARRGDDRHRQRLRGTLVRESRRLDHGPQHVRACARTLAGL